MRIMGRSEQVRDALSSRRGEISDSTGFDNGDVFEDEARVRAYFTPQNQREMFGEDAITDTVWLVAAADYVIANRWHMDQTIDIEPFCAYTNDEESCGGGKALRVYPDGSGQTFACDTHWAMLLKSHEGSRSHRGEDA